MNSCIRIPDSKLVDVIRKAYELSVPVGLGILHFKDGPLPIDVAKAIIDCFKEKTIYMDYIQGRAVKLSIFRDEGGYYLIEGHNWFDHNAAQYEQLLKVLDEKDTTEANRVQTQVHAGPEAVSAQDEARGN